jgi:predicted alpha/beta-hydrolase family hydrolase
MTWALVIVALLLSATTTGAQVPESRQTVASRPGVTQTFYLTEPSGTSAASVILFTGGEGALGFKGDGPFPRGGNFLIRHRKAFAAHGLLVAAIDVPSDMPGGYGRFRKTEEHARDVAAVIAALRRHAAVPVWVIGTSKGTISAASVAARLTDGGPDGLVLTSSATRQTRGSSDTVFDVGVESVRVPTLIVHSENDACQGTPGFDARPLFGRVRAARKELLLFNGAPAGSGEAACGPFTAHGYFGIEAEVIKAIADWIKATPSR